MKMSLHSIQGVLSRDEMRQIMAGSEGAYCGQCSYNVGGQQYTGACARNVVLVCMCPNGMFC